MTELILSVENESILPKLREMLKTFEGVKVKASVRKRESGIDLSLEEAQSGRVSEWSSVDEMFETILNCEI